MEDYVDTILVDEDEAIYVNMERLSDSEEKILYKVTESLGIKIGTLGDQLIFPLTRIGISPDGSDRYIRNEYGYAKQIEEIYRIFSKLMKILAIEFNRPRVRL